MHTYTMFLTLINQNFDNFPNFKLRAYNLHSIFFLFLTCFMFLLLTIVPPPESVSGVQKYPRSPQLCSPLAAVIISRTFR